MLLAPLMLAAAAILPNDPRIVYVGRFDRRDPSGYVCQWPASEIRLKVQGDGMVVKLEEKGNDYWQVEVDGAPTVTLKLLPGVNDYTINLGLGNKHDVRLVKRTEPFVGTTTIHSFGVYDGKLLRTAPKKRHLEFVGDSITCGFGNEGASATEKFRPETENAYMSYASVAARAVDADATLIAWSGRKMWPDNTMPEIYDLVLPTQPEPKFDFRGPAPDAVIIHLATNDFGRANPDEKGWTDAYEAFIRRVWSHYPKAKVYATIGSMMSDGYPVGHRALSTVRGYVQGLVTRMHDPRLHFLEFDQQREQDGIGAAWHPSTVTDQKMALRLTQALKRDLGW